MNDEEKLKEIFESKDSSKFDKVIKKAKLFSVIRGVMTSIIVLIIVGVIALIFNGVTLNKLGNKRILELQNYYRIAHPNSYLGTNQQDDRFMTGELDYVTYRFIESKAIFDGSYKNVYSYIPLINGLYGDNSGLLYELSGDSQQALYEAKRYNMVGKNLMKFYHPNIKYDRYIDDFDMLDQIDKAKVMEISLSFDKAYSIDELKSMIPQDITLNWYWVDTYTDNQVTDLSSHTEETGDKVSEEEKKKYIEPNIILYEGDVYGIKAIDNQGKKINSPEKDFVDTITFGRTNKGNYQQLYKTLFSKLSKDSVKVTRDDLKIIGLVVSGDRDALISLKGKYFIKASCLGAVVDKY